MPALVCYRKPSSLKEHGTEFCKNQTQRQWKNISIHVGSGDFVGDYLTLALTLIIKE